MTSWPQVHKPIGIEVACSANLVDLSRRFLLTLARIGRGAALGVPSLHLHVAGQAFLRFQVEGAYSEVNIFGELVAGLRKMVLYEPRRLVPV